MQTRIAVLLLLLHNWGYFWMPITFCDFITLHLTGFVKICLSGTPFLIWRSRAIKLGFYKLFFLAVITEKLKNSFDVCSVSGTVLQYHDQSCLCFFFLNVEKGKVPKEGTSAGVLYPTFMPTGFFCAFLCYLGYVCYTAGESLPFCFFENGSIVSSLFCHQLKKWYKCFQVACLGVPLKWTKYVRLATWKATSGSEQTGDQREFRCFYSKISHNRHPWFKYFKLFIPFMWWKKKTY